MSEVTRKEFEQFKFDLAERFNEIANIIDTHNKTFDVLGSSVKIQQEHLKELKVDLSLHINT